MKNRKVIFSGVLLFSLLLLVGGCAQTQMTQQAAATVKAQPLAENPVELVNQLDHEIANARSNQLNILSPTWFLKAESAYFEAKKNLEGGKEISVIKKNVLSARTSLQQAEDMAKISRTTLPEVIKAREMARSAGAVKSESDYARVEGDFLEMTKAIEKNDLRFAQNNQKKVANDFRLLEIRAIKENTIGEVRKLIAKAENNGARKIAPKTFQEAVNQLQETDSFITRNPYAKEQMHEMANKALFLANRAVVVTDQSIAFRDMQPEEISLWSENNLHTIATALSAPDMRDQKFTTQLDNIVGSVASLKNDRTFVTEKNKELQNELWKDKADHQAVVDNLHAKIATLEGATRQDQVAMGRAEKERQNAEQKLMSERRFNQKYSEVQKYFTKDEAEVYKQENRLVLRLKTVGFPIGKSIIMPENYSLLSKVQKSIRNFNDPQVIVEGHTDSTGTNELNQQLSQERANAVMEYMIANQTLSANHIAAVGYGSERPLASNVTPEGRAVNRRIDIIITPQNDMAGVKMDTHASR